MSGSSTVGPRAGCVLIARRSFGVSDRGRGSRRTAPREIFPISWKSATRSMRVHRVIVHSDGFRQNQGVSRDAAHVCAGHGIVCVYRVEESFEGGGAQALELAGSVCAGESHDGGGGGHGSGGRNREQSRSHMLLNRFIWTSVTQESCTLRDVFEQ